MTLSAEEVADHIAITDKIYRYCRSVDRLDVPLGYTVFHEDSVAIFPTYEGTGRGWIDAVCVAHLDFLHHSHQVTNIVIELDGDRAGSESYVIAKLRSQEDGKLFEREFSARYIDKWSKRGGDWAIDRRDCILDFDRLTEVTALGAELAGRRDHSDPSYTAIGKVSA